MSGGHFNYNQYYIEYIARDIENEIRDNKVKNEWTSDETIKEFRKAVKALRRAYVYAHRIDWLLSGDDGEETFHERLKEELKQC